jgi:hypothetical protein
MRNLSSVSIVAALGALTVVLGGCPVWTDDGHYDDDGCWDCCRGEECNWPVACSSSADCASGEVCGADNECHAGSCELWGCSDGFVCSGSDTCVAAPGSGGGGTGGAGAGGAGGEGGAGGGADVVYCGNPDDCGPAEFCAPDGTCQPGDCSFDGCIDGFFCNTLPESPVCDRLDSNGCGEDADCNTADGYLCVSGQCTAPADLCTDQTQCASGSVCAEGKCVPSCAGGGACPSDFTCTSPLELCNGAVTACTITDDCGGFDSVCVDGACVARSLDGTCPTGFAWVDNGCIPDQAAAFLCAIDGSQDACAAGSICLHHSCYISCEAPNETACDALVTFDQCKSVTTPSGTHAVCGSADNLGSECDPTAGSVCTTGFICVDGFCK